MSKYPKFFVLGRGSGSGPTPEPPFPTTPEDNQLFYRTITGNAIQQWNEAFFDENGDPLTIESNVYQDGYGVLTFSGDIKGMGIMGTDRYIVPDGPDTILRDVLMPDCIEYFGQRLFYYLPNLETVNIPTSLTALGSYCFYNTPKLAVDMDLSNVTTINGTYHFWGSGIKSVVLNNTLTSLPNYFLHQCSNLTSLEIPATVTTIGNYCFDGTSIRELVIPEGVTTIGTNCLQNSSNLVSLSLPSTLTSIGGRFLDGAYSLETITIPPENQIYRSGTNNDAIYTGTALLYGTKNTVIENGTECIEGYAFYKQYGLQSIVIPSSVNEIKTYAFGYCVSLTSIESLATTAPTVYMFTFSDIAKNGVLTVHNADYSAWMSTGNNYLGKYNWTCEGMGYPVNVYSLGNGTVSVDGVSGDFNEMVLAGSELELGATPDQGYLFTTWDDGDATNPRTATVDYAINLGAQFDPDVVYHTVTVNANEHADIYVDGTQISGDTQFTVAEGDQVELSVSAHNGYFYAATLFSDGTETSFDNPTTYTLGNSDVTIWFDVQNYITINLTSNDSSMGLVGFDGDTPAATVVKSGIESGMCQFIHAYPETGYEFVRWESNDIYIPTPSDNPGSACSNVDGTVTAVFQAAAPQQPDDELWYVSSNSQAISPYDSSAFGGATIVSNTYANGKGIVKFDQNLTSIGDNAFYTCSDMTHVWFPDTLLSVGKHAFDGCPIENLDLNNITTVGYEAFDDHHTAHLHIPATFTTIDTPEFGSTPRNNPFRSSYLTTITVDSNNPVFSDGSSDNGSDCIYDGSILWVGCPSTVIPDNCTTLGQWCFSTDNSLYSMDIPASVTSIEDCAFDDCPNLSELYVHSVPTFSGYYTFNSSGQNGTLYYEHGVDPTDWLNVLPNGWSAEVIADDTMLVYTTTDGQAVTPDDSTAFGGATIVSNNYYNGVGVITFDQTLTAIGNAFKNCTTLETVKIPDAVTSLSGSTFNGSFYGCTALTDVTMPAGLTTINSRSFYGTTITNVYYGGSLDEWAAIDNSPNSAHLYIGGNLVTDLSDMTTDATYIGNRAFQGNTDITSAIIPDTVTNMGYSAFMNCTSLASFTLSSGLSTLSQSTFAGCTSLTTATVPVDISYIDAEAFRGCTGLTSVTMAGSLTDLQDYAFRDCTSLASITFSGSTVPTMYSAATVFYNVASTGTVYGESGLDYSTIMAALPSGWTLVQ